jgi:ABC-type polysaccharide/polyol phosphate export permease
LRTAPISPLRIVFGKLWSVIWTLLLVLMASVPGYVVMSFIQPEMSGQVSNVVTSMVIAVAMVVSISACVSSFSRNTSVATATSYGVLLALFAGTLLIWLAQGRPFGALFVERVLMLNPAAAALSEMKAPGFGAYRLAPTCWWIGGGIAGLCLCLMSLRVWKMTKPD